LQLFDVLAAATELFVGARQSPVGRGEVVINLDGGAEFERGVLPLAVFEELFAAAQVFGLRFFGAGAGRGDRDEEGEQENGQRPESPGARALLKIHLTGTPSLGRERPWLFGVRARTLAERAAAFNPTAAPTR
jgi:hypothetical protein